jgi:hypothetical protein
MRVHGNQFDQNLQLDGALAAAKAEAKKQAARTRKNLLNSASALAGEYGDDDCVVTLSRAAGSRQHAGQQNSETEGGSHQAAPADAEIDPAEFSDWA